MKLYLREVEEIHYLHIKKTITIELKDYLPSLLKDLNVKFDYSEEELNKITTGKELKSWIEFKESQAYYNKLGLNQEQRYDLDMEAEIDKYERSGYYGNNKYKHHLDETKFNFKHVLSDWFTDKTLFEWIALRNRNINIGDKTLNDILNNSDIIVNKEDSKESWIEILDKEGEITKDLRTIS